MLMLITIQSVRLSLKFEKPPCSPSMTRLRSRMDLDVTAQALIFSGHPTATFISSAKPVTMLATSPAQPEEGGRTLRDELPGLCSMARPSTLPLGTGLVALGAFGARRTAGPADGVGGRLCLSALLTAITTVGSMLINDYHDHKRGVDTEWTKPGRPLVTGEVPCSILSLGMPPHVRCVHTACAPRIHKARTACTRQGAARVGQVCAQVGLRGPPHAALPR